METSWKLHGKLYSVGSKVGLAAGGQVRGLMAAILIPREIERALPASPVLGSFGAAGAAAKIQRTE